MRIHTDSLTSLDLTRAARAARVDFDRLDQHGSRSRDRSFDFTLRGESRRAPNFGANRDGRTGISEKAATWDQWGVFLSVLFDADPYMTVPQVYTDREEFDYKTFARFSGDEWPEDAHGDHRFEYAGIPYTQACKNCTARNRWK